MSLFRIEAPLSCCSVIEHSLNGIVNSTPSVSSARFASRTGTFAQHAEVLRKECEYCFQNLSHTDSLQKDVQGEVNQWGLQPQLLQRGV